MDTISLDNESFEYGRVYFNDVFYELEILTTRIQKDSNVYFSFIRLFDWIVN